MIPKCFVINKCTGTKLPMICVLIKQTALSISNFTRVNSDH